MLGHPPPPLSTPLPQPPLPPLLPYPLLLPTPVLGGRLSLTLASPPPNCPGNPSCRPSQPLTLPPSQLQLGWAGKGTQGHLGPLSHSSALFPLEVASGPHGSWRGSAILWNPAALRLKRLTPYLQSGSVPLSGKPTSPLAPRPGPRPPLPTACSSCSGARSPRGRQKGQK